VLFEKPSRESIILDALDAEIALPGAGPPPEDTWREPSLAAPAYMIGFDDNPAPDLGEDPGIGGPPRQQPAPLDAPELAEEIEEPVFVPEPIARFGPLASFGLTVPGGAPRRQPAPLDRELVADDIEELPPDLEPLPRLGPLGSLGLHLLVLLVLLTWTDTPMELTGPIPVQLVLETPSPESAQMPAAPTEDRGPRASEDVGGPDASAPQTSTEPQPAVPTPDSPEPVPAPQKQAAMIPPPPPPKPAPPKPKPVLNAPPKPTASAETKRLEPNDRPAPRPAVLQGPPATRDEYLAYLVTLTRRHLDMLPLSVVGDRRGETVIGVVVRDDGALLQVSIAGSSGYPDIDRRVEAMVRAVGRFPPLPQWFQGNEMQLELKLRFPEALN